MREHKINHVRMHRTLRQNLDVRIAAAEEALVKKGWSRQKVREYLDALRKVFNEAQAVGELEGLVRYETSFIPTPKKVYAIPIA